MYYGKNEFESPGNALRNNALFARVKHVDGSPDRALKFLIFCSAYICFVGYVLDDIFGVPILLTAGNLNNLTFMPK